MPTPPTKMRLGLGTIVETKHIFDHYLQIGWNLNGSGAASIVAAGMLVFLQLDAKCLIHCSDRSGENNLAAGRALFFYRSLVFATEGLDADNGLRGGTMALLEFFATQNRAFGDRFGESVRADNRLFPCARTQTDGDVKFFVGVGWANLSRSYEGSALTTGKCFFRSRHKSPFCEA